MTCGYKNLFLKSYVIYLFSMFLVMTSFLFILSDFKAFSETPAFSMYPTNPQNPSFPAKFYYTTDDNVLIYDYITLYNADPDRNIGVKLSGKYENSEGWFAFSENPVILAPSQTKEVQFLVSVPDNVCQDAYTFMVYGSLQTYDGMGDANGMRINPTIAVESVFNINSGNICSDPIPGLGALPSFVPYKTAVGDVPVVVSGGGGGGTNPPLIEVACSDGADNDGDGNTDCFDGDCLGNSACMTETACSDSRDNDADGRMDCADSDCSTASNCVPETNCTDTIDNDTDTLVDCLDPDCASLPVCTGETNCADLLDNDLDGNADCADSDCASFPACMPETLCADLIDNDSDTFTDCADSDCASFPACEPELLCADLLDNDSDTKIDCLDSDCSDAPNCKPESICDNLLDDDLDGNADCFDDDCDLSPACLKKVFINVLAYPEKRVYRVEGNYSTRGLLRLYKMGSMNPDYTLAAPLNNAGEGKIEQSVDTATYHASFKGLSHLTRFMRGVTLESGKDSTLDFTFGGSFKLLAGDVQIAKDDFMNSLDLSATVIKLYENDEHADLNRDGTVNSLDLSIESFNIYKKGEQRVQ